MSKPISIVVVVVVIVVVVQRSKVKKCLVQKDQGQEFFDLKKI